jgi:putative lipoprotein
MKLKFFPSLILVVLLGGCSLLSQGDEEASFLADASGCDVASSLNKEQSNRCAKRQKIDAKVAQTAQEQAASQDTLIHLGRIARKLSKERSSSISPRSEA